MRLALLIALGAVALMFVGHPATAQVVCTGDCLGSLFPTPATNTVCDSAHITVTGASSGASIFGGDIYTFGSWPEIAAVHQGLAASGQTVALYVFYVGVRSAFFSRRANGILSGYSTSGHGFILSTTNACPTTFTATMTPVTPALAPDTSGAVFGTSVYRYLTRVNRAAEHVGLLPSGGTFAGPTYVHLVNDSHVPFYSSVLNGITSTAHESPDIG